MIGAFENLYNAKTRSSKEREERRKKLNLHSFIFKLSFLSLCAFAPSRSKDFDLSRATTPPSADALRFAPHILRNQCSFRAFRGSMVFAFLRVLCIFASSRFKDFDLSYPDPDYNPTASTEMVY